MLPLVKDESLVFEKRIRDGILDIGIVRTNPSGKLTMLSEVLNYLPNGHIVKYETGMGATTLEIRSKRNSIIVQPLKVTASTKATLHQNSLYIGSSTKDQVAPTDKMILAYCNKPDGSYKKLIVVADSLQRLPKLLGDVLYKDYFLLIDEIDSFQLDAGFREKMEDCIEIYKKFPEKKRAMISATEIDFSDPALQNERRTELYYDEYFPRNIDVICTNDVKATGYDKIVKTLQAHPKAKIMIAFNSVSGCRTIADRLVSSDILPVESIKIMCSIGSQREVVNYKCDFDGDTLPAKVCFFTVAYFSGFDLNESYHLISLSGNSNRIHSLSDNRLKQIAGRCRKTLLSETIVHDLIHWREYKKERENLEGLISAAETEITALKCIEKNYQSNALLGENLNKVRDFIVRYTLNEGYALVRKSIEAPYEYSVSYFNIDAYLENVRVQDELYLNPRDLYKRLKSRADIVRFTEVETAQSIDDIKTTKNTRAEIVIEAINTIRDCNMATLNKRLISKDASRMEKNLIRIYLDHCEFIDKEQLLTELERLGSYPDSRKMNKFVQAMYYESLEATYSFKRTVKTHIQVGKRYTNKELLDKWNLIIAEAGIHKVLRSSVYGVRLTQVYFRATRQKENQEEKQANQKKSKVSLSIYLIKSNNPYKLKVIKTRKTYKEDQIINLVEVG